jgi:hypothetical protein
VEQALKFLQAARDAGAEQDAIESAERLLAAARLARDKATPPAVARRRLEERIAAKEAALSKAKVHCKTASDAVVAAQAAGVEADRQAEERTAELAKLQAELEAIEEADDGEFSCEEEDADLEVEFRGSVEVVRLHRQLEAAKTKVREGHAAKVGHEGDATVNQKQNDKRPLDAQSIQVDMDLEGVNFEGDDFDDEDLKTLGIGTGDDGEGSSAKKARLAEWVEVQTKKRLQGETRKGPNGKVVRLAIKKGKVK